MTAASVSVRAATDADRANWNAFAEASPAASFFHLFEWRDIMRDVFGHRTHYLLAEQAGRVCGVLPLAQVKSRLFGHSLVSLPFGVYGGVAADNEAAALAK